MDATTWLLLKYHFVYLLYCFCLSLNKLCTTSTRLTAVVCMTRHLCSTCVYVCMITCRNARPWVYLAARHCLLLCEQNGLQERRGRNGWRNVQRRSLRGCMQVLQRELFWFLRLQSQRRESHSTSGNIQRQHSVAVQLHERQDDSSGESEGQIGFSVAVQMGQDYSQRNQRVSVAIVISTGFVYTPTAFFLLEVISFSHRHLIEHAIPRGIREY